MGHRERRHRDGLRSALDDAARHIAAAQAAAGDGDVDTAALARAVTDVTEALGHGHALRTAQQLRFALPADPAAGE